MRLVAARAQGRVDACYGATFGEVYKVGRHSGHCTRDAGWGLDTQIHVVGDGADWIRLQSREVFGDRGRLLLDFYHVCEYLAAAAPACRPRSPNPWRKTQQRRLKRGAVQLAIKTLAQNLEPTSLPEEQAPVHTAHRYLSSRRDQLDYPRAMHLGFPIGSGLIESGHRHLVQARLKAPGTAWLPDNADDIAQLRVLRANGHRNSLWITPYSA